MSIQEAKIILLASLPNLELINHLVLTKTSPPSPSLQNQAWKLPTRNPSVSEKKDMGVTWASKAWRAPPVMGGFPMLAASLDFFFSLSFFLGGTLRVWKPENIGNKNCKKRILYSCPQVTANILEDWEFLTLRSISIFSFEDFAEPQMASTVGLACRNRPQLKLTTSRNQRGREELTFGNVFYMETLFYYDNLWQILECFLVSFISYWGMHTYWCWDFWCLESAAKSDSPEKQRYLNEKDWDMWERPHPNCHTWELFDFMDISTSPVASTSR